MAKANQMFAVTEKKIDVFVVLHSLSGQNGGQSVAEPATASQQLFRRDETRRYGEGVQRGALHLGGGAGDFRRHH